MSAIEDREHVVLIDLSRATSSTEAIRQLESELEGCCLTFLPGQVIHLNTGSLLLTPGILARMKTVIQRYGAHIETLYSGVPQTQQFALDEGLTVKRSPVSSISFDFDLEKRMMKPPVFDLTSLPEASPALPLKETQTPSSDPFSMLSITLDDGQRQEIHSVGKEVVATVYYRQTLRSGQILQSKGHVVIIGDAHSGSEIIAGGDIVVWGCLNGIAHAGSRGNNQAEIRALRIDATQLRIGTAIARKPDRLFKQKDRGRAPEVAKIGHGEIRIFQDKVERS